LRLSDFAIQLWPGLKISLWMALVVLASRLFLLWCGITSPYVNLGILVGVGMFTYAGLLYCLRPPLLSHVYDLLVSADSAGMRMASGVLRVLLRKPSPSS
jgi:hypothetical protein